MGVCVPVTTQAEASTTEAGGSQCLVASSVSSTLSQTTRPPRFFLPCHFCEAQGTSLLEEPHPQSLCISPSAEVRRVQPGLALYMGARVRIPIPCLQSQHSYPLSHLASSLKMLVL